MKSGRIDNVKIEIMPAGFAGGSGADALGAGLGMSVVGGFALGVGKVTDNALKQFALRADASGRKQWSNTSQVGASGFELQAMLYEGPGRTFDYDVEPLARVQIRHVVGRTLGGWPRELGRRVVSLVTPGERENTTVRDPVETRSWSEDVPRGRVRFVVPEALTLSRPFNPDLPGGFASEPSRTILIRRCWCRRRSGCSISGAIMWRSRR